MYHYIVTLHNAICIVDVTLHCNIATLHCIVDVDDLQMGMMSIIEQGEEGH